MSCEFISELRRLSKLSAEAVQNLDHFDPLKNICILPVILKLILNNCC